MAIHRVWLHLVKLSSHGKFSLSEVYRHTSYLAYTDDRETESSHQQVKRLNTSSASLSAFLIGNCRPVTPPLFDKAWYTQAPVATQGPYGKHIE
jgi:hypothetical protein